MKFNVGSEYITLNEESTEPVSAVEEELVAEAVRKVWPPLTPSADFVASLEVELLETAAHQQETQHRVRQVASLLGILGGGILSLVGGVLLWRSWRKKRTGDSLSSSSGGMLAAASG